jgi:hypothetical protein
MPVIFYITRWIYSSLRRKKMITLPCLTQVWGFTMIKKVSQNMAYCSNGVPLACVCSFWMNWPFPTQSIPSAPRHTKATTCNVHGNSEWTDVCFVYCVGRVTESWKLTGPFAQLIKPADCTETFIQGDQKASMHLKVTVQKNTQKYFKQFQSLTIIR